MLEIPYSTAALTLRGSLLQQCYQLLQVHDVCDQAGPHDLVTNGTLAL